MEGVIPPFRHIGTLPGSLVPRDLFQPHMPTVDVLLDMDEFFAHAREHCVTAVLGEEMCRQRVVIVTPGRALLFFTTPAPGTWGDGVEAKAEALLGGKGPLQISVISYTKLEAVMEDKEHTKSVPFLGNLVRIAYCGHRVVVFEGHSSALASGVRGADLLLVDSGMLPFLRNDWKEIAFAGMSPGGRILLHDRPTCRLLAITRESGAAARPGNELADEMSYVHHLLTVLSEGPKRSVPLVEGAVLPDLGKVASRPCDLQRISTLGFNYEQLNASKAMWLLRQAAAPAGFLRRWLVVEATIDGGSKGERPVSFKLTPCTSKEGRQQLDVERL